jgi:hypothetical protein
MLGARLAKLLPMKFAPRLSWLTASAAFLAVASFAQAHPGHDGGHDLTWELGHYIQHPFATFVWAALIGASIWSVWQLVANREEQRAVVKRDDEDQIDPR